MVASLVLEETLCPVIFFAWKRKCCRFEVGTHHSGPAFVFSGNFCSVALWFRGLRKHETCKRMFM